MLKRRKLLLWLLVILLALVVAAGAWFGRVALIQAAVDREAARLLSEDEAEVRAAVAELSSMKTATAARHLLRLYLTVPAAALKDPYAYYTPPESWRLGRLGRMLPFVFEGMGEPAVDPLVTALGSEFKTWSERLGETLEVDATGVVPTNEEKRRAIEERRGALAYHVALSLGRIGQPAVPGLIKVFEDPANDDLVRSWAASALGKTGAPEALDPLVEAVASPPSRVSQSAAGALGAFGDRATAKLLPLLESDDPQIRYMACAGLHFAEGAEAADALLTIASADGDPRLTHRAITGLEHKGETRALKALLDHDDEAIRRRAVVALGRLGDRAVLEPLLKLARASLDETDPEYSSAWMFLVLDALGAIGDPAATGTLTQLLSSDDKWVASAAAGALGSIGDDSSVEALIREASRNADNVDDRYFKVWLWALARMENAEARRVAVDLFLRSRSVRSDEVREILETQGLEAFAANWRSHIFRKWAEEHTELFAVALEIYGTPEMARGYLDCYPWEFLKRVVCEWAERHGHEDIAEEAR